MSPTRLPAPLRLILRWVVLLAGGYVALVILIFLLQRRLQYIPDPSDVPVPAGAAYRGLEDVTLEADDGVRLRAWHWPGERPVTLVIFHGNAGSRLHRLEWIADLHALGLGVFILDYRGYGGSGGSPTEEGLYLDAEAALRWLEGRDAGSIVLVGESLGGGVAIEMAARRRVAGLILHSPFTSAVDVARDVYPFLPVALLMKDRFENLEKIARIGCPSLVIHGTEDEIVSLELGRRLFDAAPEPKELWVVSEADHNGLIYIAGRSYYDKVDAFIRERVEAAPVDR